MAALIAFYSRAGEVISAARIAALPSATPKRQPEYWPS